MNAEQIMDVRRRVYGEVNEAREELGELEARVGAIWADAARFTIDARTEDVRGRYRTGGVASRRISSRLGRSWTGPTPGPWSPSTPSVP